MSCSSKALWLQACLFCSFLQGCHDTKPQTGRSGQGVGWRVGLVLTTTEEAAAGLLVLVQHTSKTIGQMSGRLEWVVDGPHKGTPDGSNTLLRRTMSATNECFAR